MKTERFKNSIYNGLSNLFLNISVTILSFVVRSIFIKNLGEQNLGLDGLFTNVLSFLSLAELGFGTAIAFSLFEPLAKKNNNKINELMSYFKTVYRKIGFFVFFAGLLVIPFLGFICKGYTVPGNLYLIYILYLLNTASTYFTSYTSVLIEADQKLYKLTKIKFVFNLIVYGLQIISLKVYKNFIIYLIIQFVFRFIERFITNEYIKRQYSDNNFKDTYSISKSEKKKINKNIKGIIFHKVGDYAVNGTDNILISTVVNISMTGIYYNYVSIVSILRNLIGSMIFATSSSFGNLNVLESSKTKKNVFEVINFCTLFFTGICLVGLYFCINSFISMWIGKNYLLNSSCIIVICANFYLNCIMIPITAIKNSSGIYYVDRYVPIIQAIINLGVSIILGIKFGIIGVLLGTTISSILTVNVIKPYIIYKYVFNSKCYSYFKDILKHVIVLFISIFISITIFKYILIGNVLLRFIAEGLICVSIYLIVFMLLYYNTKEFKYIFGIVKEKIKK